MSRPFRLRNLLVTLGCGLLITAPAATLAQDTRKSGQTRPGAQQETLSSAQLLYTELLSEIAVARGALAEAAASYLDLARKTGDSRLARRATEIAVASRQSALAIAAARVWVAAEPESVMALQTLAAVLAGNPGQMEELEGTLKSLLARPETRREGVFMLLPQTFARFPDKQAARQTIERLTASDLHLPEAQYARALAAFFAADPVGAERAVQEALRLRPDWEVAALLRARFATPEQQGAAMQALQEFGRLHPMALESRLTYARWLAGEKRVAEARAAYVGLLEEFPENQELAYNVMPIAVQVQDFETAERVMRDLAARGFRDANLMRLQLGEILEERGNDSEAAAQYEAVTAGQHLAAARVRLAQLLARGGDSESALKVLREVDVARPDDKILILRAEADILRRADKTAAAHATLEKALALQPDNTDVLYDAALLAERLKQPAVMEQRLRRLIRLKPDHAHAYNALGYSFADRKINLAEADNLLQTALKLAPNDPAILDSVGWLRFRQGNLPAAIEYIRKAYDLLKDVEVAAHLSEVLWNDGRFTDARKLLEESGAANPDNAILQDVKRRLGM